MYQADLGCAYTRNRGLRMQWSEIWLCLICKNKSQSAAMKHSKSKVAAVGKSLARTEAEVQPGSAAISHPP